MKVFLLLRHEFEGQTSHQWTPTTKVIGVFAAKETASAAEDKGYEGYEDPSDAPFGLEIMEFEVS